MRTLAEPPAATPPPPAANESPAAPAVTPAPPAVPDPASGLAASAAAPSGHPDDEPLPPEVEASLGDPGRRAIQTERERRKAATAKAAELQAELDRLKAQLAPAPDPNAPPSPAAPATPGAPATPAAPPAPSAAWPSELARCETFEQVVQAARQASALGSLAMRLNTTLATQGLDAAVEKLRSQGLETFQGIPLEQLTAGDLADRLQQAWDTAEAVRLDAPVRADYLRGERASFGQAVTVLPGLKDTQSAHSKQFNQIVAANPSVKQLGPQWPMLVARQILGMEAEARMRQPAAAPAVPALTPAPAVPVAPPPAAPRHAAVTPGVGGAQAEVEILRQKIDAGKATEADMDRFASLEIQR